MHLPISVLDVAPIPSGSTGPEALRRVLDLARLADRLGFARYWFAEHHSMPAIASSAPEVLIAHVAGATERIRVGAGGIMLPNHVPLRVAETFHTLEALYPGRIDLGIGRAPGTDPAASRALRAFDAGDFPVQLAELRAFSARSFPKDHPFHSVQVVPGDVALPPIWLLGSSGASAQLAGRLGMGYGFASHFSPAPAAPALQAYRESFEPSERFERPHAIAAASVVCAETDEHAEYLAASMDLMWVQLRTGRLGPVPSPEEALAYPYTPQDRAVIEQYRGLSIVGRPERVRERIEALAAETGADEVMVMSNVHDHAERLRSHELIAEAFEMAPLGG
jgi:luciferase family oxidoreductase group 1